MIIPFGNEILKNWFLEFLPLPPYKDDEDAVISTLGSEPYDESFLDEMLAESGLKINVVRRDANILIIGRENWNEEYLDELLNLREGKQLKVYSQEMFLAYWITGQDPFDYEEVALSFADEHPALEYLLSCWVDWVSTSVSRSLGGGNLGLDDSPEIGVLKHLGYTVGKTKGLHFSERRQILAKLFNSHLYEILSTHYIKDCKTKYPPYLEKWGVPNQKDA